MKSNIVGVGGSKIDKKRVVTLHMVITEPELVKIIEYLKTIELEDLVDYAIEEERKWKGTLVLGKQEKRCIVI